MVKMDIFYDENGAAYVTADIKLTEDEAITYANKHFHLKKDALIAKKAIVRKDELIFSVKNKRSGDQIVWAIYKK